MASRVQLSNLRRVPLHKNKHHHRSGLKSYCYALQKYSITPTKPGPSWSGTEAKTGSKLAGLKEKLLGKSSSTTSPGYESAESIQHDAEYLCPVEIGSPPQTLNLDFDTGSSDLWCWSTSLPRNILEQFGSNHNVFNPEKSETFVPKEGFAWKISYGDSSSASGIIGNDQVTVGGLTIPFQAVELANEMSAQFQQGAGDGLLGLAWGKINTATPHHVYTPVENMIKRDEVPQDMELFTAHLGSYHDPQVQSFYTFGYIDNDVLAANNVSSADDIYYTPVNNSNGFWEFDSTQASVNGKTVSLPGNNAIADTGTTLILVSDKLCEAIYEQVPGATYSNQAGGYIFPSSTTADQLPDVQLAVGNKLFPVLKDQFAFSSAGQGYSFGGIQSNGNLGLDIFGDVFLKGIYAIFDQGNERFGAIPRVEGS